MKKSIKSLYHMLVHTVIVTAGNEQKFKIVIEMQLPKMQGIAHITHEKHCLPIYISRTGDN